MNRKNYIEEAGIKNQAAEYLRRADLLGLEGEFENVCGHSQAFYPVDPEEPAWHPDLVKSTVYPDGYYSSSGRLYWRCNEQFCTMPCECCQLDLSNVINGYDPARRVWINYTSAEEAGNNHE